MRAAIGVVLPAILVGCSDNYILTTPDTLATTASEAPVVVRLQRRDFFVLAMPSERSLMQLRVKGQPPRGAFTDDLGYAATTVPTPPEQGRHDLQVSHADRRGDEISRDARIYTWPADGNALAVDLDSLPLDLPEVSEIAAEALKAHAPGGRVAYFTRKGVDEHDWIHKRLRVRGFPDGPILLWQRQRWHVVPGPWKLPRIKVETRLVSQLDAVREQFPNLSVGIAGSRLSAKAFAEAGMKVIVIGSGVDTSEPAVRRSSWSDFSDRGL
jgi:hypothetical protein